MKLASRIFAILLVSVIALSAPAGAQTPQIYDGVTVNDLQSILAKITVNGEPIGVTQRVTPEGVPYFEINSDQIGAPMIVSQIGGQYDQTTGAALGFQWLFIFNRTSRADANFINDFNRAQVFVKLYAPAQGVIMLTSQYVAAGGVTENNIAAATTFFFRGLGALGKALSAANTLVAIDADEVLVGFAGAAHNADAPVASVAELKISNLKSLLGDADSPALDAHIHAAIDAAAR